MIGGAITGLLVALALWFLARSAAQSPVLDDEGAVVIAYPGAIGWIGVALLLLGAGLVAFLWASFGMHSRSDVLALLALVGMIALFTLPLIVEGRRRVRMGTRGLDGYLLSRTPTHIGWDEVSEVRFSRWSGYLTLKARDGRKIGVSAFMKGSGQLADLVSERLDADGTERAVAAFHRYRRNYGL